MDNADKQAREILNIITNDLIGGDVENIYDVPTQEKNTSVIAQALREKDVLIKELQEDVSSWKRTASDCASDSRKMKKDKDDELAWWHELAQREIKGKVTSLPDYIKSLNVEIERLKFAIKINDDENGQRDDYYRTLIKKAIEVMEQCPKDCLGTSDLAVLTELKASVGS